MNKIIKLSVTALLALAFVASSCGSDDTESTTTTSPASGRELTGDITVSAAASLTESFTTIRDEFVRANPDTTVTINFGSSGQLSTQIQEGAPVDVAAFADEAPMSALDESGLLAAPATIFARNELVIVTKPGNPKGIDTLDDLATAGVVSLCATTAPCGKYADQILQTAGVVIPDSSITRGQDVKATLTAVTEGDAEAAIVYVTDAEAAGSGVDTVDIPETDNVVASYPIAVTAATTNEETAKAFADFVLGERGQDVLRAAGFLSP